MVKKAPYQTKQMGEMLGYLKSVQGSHVTVHDIKNYFEEKGIHVGMTTIYRHLERMVNEGIVAKYVLDGNSSACFEYLGTKQHGDGQLCFHCKCESCGKLLHVQCQELSGLGNHLLAGHGFQMNSMRTVFYGICEECRTACAEEVRV